MLKPNKFTIFLIKKLGVWYYMYIDWYSKSKVKILETGY